MAARVTVKVTEHFSRNLTKWVRTNRIRPCMNRIAAQWRGEQAIRQRLVEPITKTTTWAALRGDYETSAKDLHAALGIENPREVLADLKDFLMRGLEIVPTSRGNARGIHVGFISASLQDELLNADFGSYISLASGFEIPWLRWILTRLSDPVLNYELLYFAEGDTVTFDQHKDLAVIEGKSRTGKALMGKLEGEDWDIEPHLSALGVNANFLIDAFEGNEGQQIRQYLVRKFERDVKACLRQAGLTNIAQNVGVAAS